MEAQSPSREQLFSNAALNPLEPDRWHRDVVNALGAIRGGGTHDRLETQASKATALIERIQTEVARGAAVVWEDYAQDYDRWMSQRPDEKRGIRALREFEIQSRIYQRSGIFILVADCLLAAYFIVTGFASLRSPGYQVIAALLAILFSVAFAFGTEAVAGTKIWQPEDQPHVGKVRGVRYTTVFGVLSAIGAAGFILARQVLSLPDFLADALVDWSLAWLCILLPPFSGVLLSLGRHLRWSHMHEQRARIWYALISDLEALSHECAVIKSKAERSGPLQSAVLVPTMYPHTEQTGERKPTVDEPQSRDLGGPSVGSVVGVLLLALSASACEPASGESGAAAISALPANSSATAGPVDVLEFFIDTTASVNPQQVKSILPMIIRQAVHDDFIGRVDLTLFADRGWSAVPKLSISLPPPEAANCTDLEAEMATTRRDSKRKKLLQQCDAREDSILDTYRTARGQIHTHLLAMLPTRFDDDVCTGLWEVLERVQHQ